ncbi:MAG: OB-fold nucleic acid binding domain-containing protein [Thermoplasmata archaeon]|nr:OB-fold nucleic acid binding domain-containing protein [Thermoplasmata archaeon]MCI4356260.1 OB-fold nucleic acid binding domain-containing protein [Thermoplasmata archaeon]
MPESRPPATFISDLRPSRVATIEATVSELEAVRDVATREGTPKRVRNARLKDATGEISLVLWGTEVDSVAVGDRIRIVEGWVSDYRGRPQISVGRTGKLERLEGRSGPAPR